MFQSVIIENTYWAIYLVGGSSTYCDAGTIVRNCTIGAATANDIGNGANAVSAARFAYQTGISVYNNEIRNVTTTGAVNLFAMYLENCYGTNTVYNNNIHDITTTYTSASAVITGLRLDIASGGNATVYNNMISGFSHGINAASATIVVYGIRLTGAGTVNLYYNSVRIGLNAFASSAAFHSASSIITTQNNIFVILQQKRLSEMQKDFINNMTHEFKTPISSINISADVVMDPNIVNDPSRLFTYGSVIKQENNRLNQQVDKVLQIARIESHTFHLKKEPVNINDLIINVVDNCIANSNRKLVINTDLSDSVGFIDADVLHLTNIFHNLLDNASKYSGKAPIISITSTRNNQYTVIRFSDNGPGISPEYQKRIFQKFYRIPTGNLHDVKGFGLGLYYVNTICKAHQWRIRLESSEGKGATFVIEIPD
jgi:signal transduction histidine kinase